MSAPATMRSIFFGPLKLHLRQDPDGRGTLVINAAAVLYLDKVAVRFFEAFADAWLETGVWSTGAAAVPDMPPKVIDRVARTIAKHYRVTPARAKADWEDLWARVLAVAGGGACPFSDVGVGRVDPFSIEASAPYRVDLALTYRCNNNCPHCYAGGPHQTAELDTAAWQKVIEKLAAFQVPNIVFTGGEATLRPDLPELVAHAQAQGVVTGLITNGRLLTREMVDRLAGAGLDYVQITLESVDPDIHNAMSGGGSAANRPSGEHRDAWQETVAGIRNCSGRIFTSTNTTLTKANAHTALDTARFLKELGVARFGMNAVIRAGRGKDTDEALPVEEVEAILEDVTAFAHEMDFPFLWFTPTCYHVLNPVGLGLGVKACSAASTVLAVEPDGAVMPCQSFFQSLGNAVTDSFEAMWQSELAVSLRRRQRLPAKCTGCEELHVCGGGCPLEEEGLYQGAGEPHLCRT